MKAILSGKAEQRVMRNALLSPRFLRESTGTPEEGEGFGPRKEMWDVAARDMTVAWDSDGHHWEKRGRKSMDRRIPAVLIYNRSAGCFWLNDMVKESPEARAAYALLGLLIGLAISNSSRLGVSLPQVLFTKLLKADQFVPSMKTL